MLEKTLIDSYIQKVSNRMMNLKKPEGEKEKYPVSLLDINCWEWPQGVGLYGLFQYYQRSKSSEVLTFLTEWFDRNLAAPSPEKNVNTTAPMLTLAFLYELTPKPEYLEKIREWSQWIMDRENGLIRTGDGAFQHMITKDPNDNEILIDTLFMTLLFLAKAGILLNQPTYVIEAEYQVLCHITYLYEKTKGLFYHGWNFYHQNNYGGVFWGRGNGWYTVGILEFLDILGDKASPALRNYFHTIYRRQSAALLRYQDSASHLWHTVIDDPSSYLETSAGCAFLCGMIKGLKAGLLPEKEYHLAIEQGVKAILAYIEEDGTVASVSYGTPIGANADFYKNIPCHPMTYGQALMILLLQELL